MGILLVTQRRASTDVPLAPTPHTLTDLEGQVTSYAKQFWSDLPSGTATAQACSNAVTQYNDSVRPNGSPTLLDYFYSSAKRRCLGLLSDQSAISVVQFSIADLTAGVVLISCKATTNSKGVGYQCVDQQHSWDSRESGAYPPPWPISPYTSASANTWSVLKIASS